MKKILLAFVLLTLASSSFAQKIRFSDSTNVWHVYQDGINGNYVHTLNYTGTTTIHSVVYRKIDEFASGTSSFAITECPCLIREDTLANKVFIVKPTAIDTAEQVLMDYNLRVGDTLKGNNTSTYTVASLDSVSINSRWYKVWHLTSPAGGTYNDYTIIEGIGSIPILWFPVDTEATFENQFLLTCFANNGTTPFVSPLVDGYFDNATSCTLSVNDINTKSKTANVSPNPISRDSKITLPYSISSGTLVVLNDIGQTIISTTFQHKDELLIGDKIVTPGIFFYRVTDKGTGNVFAGKVICRKS